MKTATISPRQRVQQLERELADSHEIHERDKRRLRALENLMESIFRFAVANVDRL